MKTYVWRNHFARHTTNSVFIETIIASLIFKTSTRCLQPLPERMGCKHPFGALVLAVTERHASDLFVRFLSSQSANPDGKYFAQFVCIK